MLPLPTSANVPVAFAAQITEHDGGEAQETLETHTLNPKP